MNKKALELIKQGIEMLLAETESPKEMKDENHEEEKAQKKEAVVGTDYATMSYSDLKKACVELGLEAKGTKAELVERLENADSDEEVEEEKPVAKKASKKAKKEEPVEDEDDEEEAEDEEVEAVEYSDEELEEIKESLDELDDDDLKAELKNAGISTRGNHATLVKKVLEAIKDGVIALEEDDEDEEELEDEVEEIEDEEVEDDSDEDEEDSEDDEDEDEEESDEEDEDEDDGVNDTTNMTKARKKAVKTLEKTVISDYEGGELSMKDMVAFLKDALALSKSDVKELKAQDADDIIDLYFDRMARMIDDDGELHDIESDEPYMLNGGVAHCGEYMEAKEIKKGKKKITEYTCPVCGAVHKM